MNIHVSGLYSGTNPQPGIGIARSLRAAYPSATLIGVEYSNRSSGIHWTDFDGLMLQRPWEELNLETYAELIGTILDSGAYWLSGIDLEIMWLASVFPQGHHNLLIPPPNALQKTRKPAVEAHRGLPVRIPPFISAAEHSDWELHAFCRRHDWKVWLKGPYYEAVRTHNWDVVESVRLAMNRAWSTQQVFLQSHVTGYEESVCFSAYQGELLGCGYMRKRELTHEGKTWAGEVTEVSEEFAGPLRKIVRMLDWTGGAELEMIRDPSGQLWMIECNPRFPAWIHGATIAGRNLPAMLVERASGVKAKNTAAVSEEFTRVVLELPVRPGYPLPPLPEPYAGGFGHSLKHPSGILALAERLHKLDIIDSNRGASTSADDHGPDGLAVPATYIEDLEGQDLAALATPSWLYLESTASSIFARAADLATRLSTPEVKVTNAYSIKTNPDERLIRLAYESGFMAEAISLLEVRKALQVGFNPQQVILNGPGKWWPAGLLPQTPLYAVFCDSLADLNRVVAVMAKGELRAEIVGIRLRPPNIPSRFGIPVDSPGAFEALIEAIATLPRQCSFGVHFHMASSNVGVARWWHLYDSILKWCGAIEALTNRGIETLDLGGGWFPDDWHVDASARFADAVQRVRTQMPSVTQIISEPGKAMAQPTMALGMRLLELGGSKGEITDAVVDGSIAELPMNFFNRTGSSIRMQEAGCGRRSSAARLNSLAGFAWSTTSWRRMSNYQKARKSAIFCFSVMRVATTGACLMFLAEAKRLEADESTRVTLQAAIEEWQQFPPSVISGHRDRCCRIAKDWLFAMDYSQLSAGDSFTGPRWIRQRHAWGPTRWPIHWCEAVAKKTLDCGALAALAQATLLERGVHCYTAQLIQRYTKADTKNWYRNWDRDDAEVCWIKDDLVYHEACAVVARSAEFRIWDPTASWWVNPKQFEGYGAVLALRILTADPFQVGHFKWGRHRITPNQWQQLESARGDFA